MHPVIKDLMEALSQHMLGQSFDFSYLSPDTFTIEFLAEVFDSWLDGDTDTSAMRQIFSDRTRGFDIDQFIALLVQRGDIELPETNS